MMVETVNKYGTKTLYIYSPEHTQNAIGFYQRIYWIGDIIGYKATLDNGDVIAIGEAVK